MKEITELLKEAKPLYLKRKRNRKVAFFSSVLCSLVFSVLIIRNSIYNGTDFIYDSWSEEIYQAQSGSVIEDMGLPVDDYGLLWIS